MTDRNARPLPAYNPEREHREETGVLVFHDVPEDEWSTRPAAMSEGINAWLDGFGKVIDRADVLHRMEYSDYLQTEEWRHLRRLVIRRAQYRCEVCRRVDQEWNVHHLTYERRGYEDLNDLVLLCRACHEAAHGLDSEEHAH